MEGHVGLGGSSAHEERGGMIHDKSPSCPFCCEPKRALKH